MNSFFSSRFGTISDYLATQKMPLQEWANIFHWSYWHEGFLPTTSELSLATIIGVIIITIVLSLWRTQLKKAHAVTPVYDWPIDQLLTLTVVFIASSLFYLLCRAEALNYVSSRLVPLGILVVTIGWLGRIIWVTVRKIPAERAAYLEKERFFRYLPKKRK